MQGDGDRTGARDAAALWQAFAVPLRAFVRRRLPDAIDPDDVLQEVFLRIARHDATLDSVEHVEGWIHRIARSALADALRAHRRREARSDDADPDALPDLPGEPSPEVLAELTPCVAPFVRGLAEPYRSALELTALGGLSQQEAAEQAGISLSGMKSRVQRARALLRRELTRCCTIAFDSRGQPMDYDVVDASACGPAPRAPRCGDEACAAADPPLRPSAGSGVLSGDGGIHRRP